MSYIPVDLRRLVIEQAANRCEYCGLAQEGQAATFHIDHIDPVTAGGQTTVENLALACVACSLYKGARQLLVDPALKEPVAIYHPRRDNWYEHFRWQGVVVEGLTPTGRATIEALQMNRSLILAIRREEMVFHRHPPP